MIINSMADGQVTKDRGNRSSGGPDGVLLGEAQDVAGP